MPRSWGLSRPRRARPRPRVWLALVLLLLGSLAERAGAQIPAAPGDTLPPVEDTLPRVRIPADTVEVRIPPEELGGDTIPADLRDAAEPRPVVVPMPEMPPVLPLGWALGRWEWDSGELARLPGLSLIEFLELLPGMARFRVGGFGRPVGITALGEGGGRIRVILDGFELDPLLDGLEALEALALLDLSRLRVVRSLAEIRVEVETFRLRQPEPHSVVALGTGAFQTRLLQALFSRAMSDHSVVTGAFDLASTAGIGIRERYRHSNAVFRWSTALGARSGMDAEWRRTIIDREGPLFPQQTERTDLIVRARSQLSEALIVEASLGRSSSSEEADTALLGRLGSTQAGVRAHLVLDRARGEAALRLRPEAPELGLPGAEAELRLGFQPIQPLYLEFEGVAESASGEQAGWLRAEAALNPWSHLTLFGALTAGERFTRVLSIGPLPDPGPNVQREARRTEVSGWRAGAEIAGRGATLGIAAIRSDSSPLVPFGLPFDREIAPIAVPPLAGFEAYGAWALPRTQEAVRLEGWYSRFADAARRPYTPAEFGRAALIAHRSFYQGELEPSLRLEGVLRGSTRVPDQAQERFDQLLPGFTTLNLAFHLRILDVQLFLLWDDLLNLRSAIELPGAPESFPRIIYGGSWRFRN